MQIKEVKYQSRNDFKADFICEHCGNIFEKFGYDDANYHNNVIPNAICPKCGLNSLKETKEVALENTGRNYYI